VVSLGEKEYVRLIGCGEVVYVLNGGVEAAGVEVNWV
jgi:hypothetical protein